MLVEFASADAYGAGFEFVSDELIKKEHKLKKYYASRIDDLKEGEYTDDTQMTIGLIEFMLSGEEWTKENITKYFLKAFKRDQRCGYAKGFYSFLCSVEDADEFLEKINPESIRNGAMMRSVPLSYIENKEKLKEFAKIQASITHDTHEGIVSSQAVGLIGNYFLYHKGDPLKLKEYLLKETEEIFKDNFTERVPCAGIETVDAVITVLKNTKSLAEIIDLSVKFGGDTDSVASVAVGLATLRPDYYTNDLPEFLYSDLENGKYGREYLEQLEFKFLNKYQKS